MKQFYVVAGTVNGYYHLMQYVEDITGSYTGLPHNKISPLSPLRLHPSLDSPPFTVFPDLTVDRSCRYFPEQFGGKVSGIQQTNLRLKPWSVV